MSFCIAHGHAGRRLWERDQKSDACRACPLIQTWQRIRPTKVSSHSISKTTSQDSRHAENALSNTLRQAKSHPVTSL
jgi:hypothetical protein